jgi:hypothetical protein
MQDSEIPQIYLLLILVEIPVSCPLNKTNRCLASNKAEVNSEVRDQDIPMTYEIFHQKFNKKGNKNTAIFFYFLMKLDENLNKF